MAIFGGPRKWIFTKIGFMDMDSNCLNGGQKYKTYLSPAFSRKNRSYWLMCRKTQIFAILENNYGSFSKFKFSPEQAKSVWWGNHVRLESASGHYKTMQLYFEYIVLKIFGYILLTISLWPYWEYCHNYCEYNIGEKF